MNQIIFDHLCALCNEGVYPKLTNDNTWEAATFVAEHFDLSDVYLQVDELLQKYLSN